MLYDEIPTRYNPKENEEKWYKFWEENGFFSAKKNPAKKPFCIVIPPPNVTGILHMGHALNNTIQDILIRYQRMKGKESLWMPGTDHAGIATQNMVEKSIGKEGLKRQDLGREKFIERVWQWKEQYGSTIIQQLKKLGASCDWQRIRFTMDEEYCDAVAEVFIKLYEKGLIYRGNYIINWCPRCQTALSDEEAPHQDLEGSLYYLRYPLKDSAVPASPAGRRRPSSVTEYVIVATTRPETMLGDTAVAVNPKDKRYKGLVGKTLLLPLVNREIKIIADPAVDMEFGSGAVKVTPAHDPNDYALGKKHKLAFINVMHPDARMNERAAGYSGMDRLEARQAILRDLKEIGLLEKVMPHQISAGHCYRCHTLIEPYLSKQWFVKMKPLSKPALQAVKKGRIKFYPERWTKIYLNWMENIQDWCISRQIWWGHRIPVYYCRQCQEMEKSKTNSKSQIKNSRIAEAIIVAKSKPDKCPACGSGDIHQDEDVLDTWFSSWLWPFATFKKNTEDAKADLNYFYPTSTLVTASEIIFFWVARMIMAGLEFANDIPFKDVYIHGTVRDIEGKKMSKSLGNIIDPLDIINEYGADALRFSLIAITAQGQDVYLSKERFEQGRNFANKLWNASRLILTNLNGRAVKNDLCVFFAKGNLNIVNRWILSRFYSTLKETDKNLQNYRFNEAANLLYAFFWHEFCDWYLEMIKSDIKNADTQIVMYKVLEKFLRAAHPFMPFISEEIWQRLNSFASPRAHEPALGNKPENPPTQEPENSIMRQPWPHTQEQIIDKKLEEEMALFIETVTAIRNMRQEVELPPDKEIEAIVVSPKKETREQFLALSSEIKKLAKLSKLSVEKEYGHLKSSITGIVGGIQIILPLAGVIDIEKEQARLSGRISKVEGEIKAKEKMLANKDFLRKAPEDIVKTEKEKLAQLKQNLQKIKAVKNELA